MLFILSCQCKTLSIFTPRYFIKIDGYNLFTRSLIFISSRSTFLEDLKITWFSFFYIKRDFICTQQIIQVKYLD